MWALLRVFTSIQRKRSQWTVLKWMNFADKLIRQHLNKGYGGLVTAWYFLTRSPFFFATVGDRRLESGRLGEGRRLKNFFAIEHKRARLVKCCSLSCSFLLLIELRALPAIDAYNSIRLVFNSYVMCGLRDTMAVLMITSMILLNWDYVDKDLYLEFLVSEPSSLRISRVLGNIVVTCLTHQPYVYRKSHAINMHKPRVYPWPRRENFQEVCIQEFLPLPFATILQDDHNPPYWSIPWGKLFTCITIWYALHIPILFDIDFWWISPLIFSCHIGVGLLFWAFSLKFSWTMGQVAWFIFLKASIHCVFLESSMIHCCAFMMRQMV